MQRYILSRLVQAVFSLLAVLVIVFILGRISGDPTVLLLPTDATDEERAHLEEELGLNDPMIDQFGRYIVDIFEGDFGTSVRTDRPAMDMVEERLPATLQLAGLSMAFALLIGIPIGVFSAVKRGRSIDYVARLGAVLGQSMPGFWLGIMLIYLFAVELDWVPTSGRGGIEHYILPTITMGWVVSSGIMRLTRSAMLDVLGAEYIKLARIKGVSEFKVVWKHAFKNALVPILTYTVLLFVGVISGAIVVEVVFSWPGIGQLMYNSVLQRDFPVVQTVALLLSTMYIVANLLIDILYAYISPKVRYGP